jgi:DNA-binding Lrp family transcriptional regulator
MSDMPQPGPSPKVTDGRIIQAIRDDERPFSTAEAIASRVSLSGTRVRERLERIIEEEGVKSAPVAGNVKIYWLSWDDK